MAHTETLQQPQNPLILRCHRLMEAFAKSDDERDFYLDKQEGFILFVDLDKPSEELKIFEDELGKHTDRYCLVPKLTFYEMKKIMEGFVNEKVYDIDTKEKLLDIISSKEARENFLDFIFDQESEYEKWQQYYQERSRIRIIEWLRKHGYHFVFEEDLDLTKSIIDKLKGHLFDKSVGKDVASARKILESKAKTYYSNEALNPRPKRGRPPKQAAKIEVEPQISTDIYTTVPKAVKPFLFTPDIGSALEVTFSSKFDSGEDLLANQKRGQQGDDDALINLETLNAKLESLRTLSSHWVDDKSDSEINALPSFLVTGVASTELPSPKAKVHTPPKKAVKKTPAPKKAATAPALAPAPKEKKRPLAKLRKVSPAKAQPTLKKAEPAEKKPKAAPKKALLRRKPVSPKTGTTKAAKGTPAKKGAAAKQKPTHLRRKK